MIYTYWYSFGFRCSILFIAVMSFLDFSTSEMTDKDFFDQLQKNGTACKEGTCRETDLICECFLTVEHKLSMIYKGPSSLQTILLKPLNGRAVNYHTGQTYDQQVEDTFVLADGNHSKIVILINGRFPGPQITAYEYQNISVHVRNMMNTDAVTIHWHGMQQKGTPWSDGVAFVSQCPILPGQNVTYNFKGKPFGTSFYHAHIGDQRTMGLYGPLIILPMSGQNISLPQEGSNVFVVAIQDWNHNDDADVLYQKMLVGDYDMNTGSLYNTTSDLSGALYSRFQFHSGLINGRGRFYITSNQTNGSPLTKFVVQSNQTYRFRVISAATLYPFRVFVQQHQPIYIVASDGFEIEKVPVESFIIHPGERIDFLMVANQTPGTYLLVAETLEVEAKQRNQYHVAEAIIFYNTSQNEINLNPPKVIEEVCSTTCTVFNCPFKYYPAAENRRCLSLNDVRSADPNSHTEDVEGEAIEHFFNFAFPGDKGYTPGSVNGHQFRPPSVGAYEHPDTVDYNCGACNETTICECTYAVTLDSPNKDKIYQFVLTNIGNGSGWSHPIHLHGHSFYVMKMAFGKYDKTSGRLVQNGGQDNQDLICNDPKRFCSYAKWRNDSWSNGNHPFLNWNNPPQKDSIIVPTGGYVVIRFKADNPGVWFFHCHIDLHNTNGMGMMINESPKNHPQLPNGFQICQTTLKKHEKGILKCVDI